MQTILGPREQMGDRASKAAALLIVSVILLSPLLYDLAGLLLRMSSGR